MNNENLKISIACDHAGYNLKEYLKIKLNSQGYLVKDYGTFSEKSVDYPDYIHPLAKSMQNKEHKFGIVICGSGIGVSITANKHPDVRAALSWTEDIAKFSRLHNNANILALPARFISKRKAKKIMDVFLSTNFEGGRHMARVSKINIS